VVVEKPTRASEYSSEQAELVRATCLYVATKLGDLMDELVVVGGLVPSLLIDPTGLPEGTSAHVGTLDLDVGLKLALLDEGRYRTLTERLRNAGFTQDETDEGLPTRQRWRVVSSLGTVTVDFLIPPSNDTDLGGRLRDIEKDGGFESTARPSSARTPAVKSGCAGPGPSWCSRHSRSRDAAKTRTPTTSTISSATLARGSRTLSHLSVRF
jgi:hypothetical protein